MRNNNKRILGALAVAGLVAAGGTAFTATNTIADAGDAGSATTAITGFVVSNVQYDANDANPENLDAVTFTLDKAARYVAIQTHDAGIWFQSDDLRVSSAAPTTVNDIDSCTSANAGVTWTCDVANSGASTPNETVLAANNLTVVATS